MNDETLPVEPQNEPGCICPWCQRSLPLHPEAYQYCSHCKGSFSFRKPSPAAPAEADKLNAEPPVAPAEQGESELTHGMNCAALTAGDPDADCTCGLQWRTKITQLRQERDAAVKAQEAAEQRAIEAERVRDNATTGLAQFTVDKIELRKRAEAAERQVSLAGGYHERTAREVAIDDWLRHDPSHIPPPTQSDIRYLLDLADAGRNRVREEVGKREAAERQLAELGDDDVAIDEAWLRSVGFEVEHLEGYESDALFRADIGDSAYEPESYNLSVFGDHTASIAYSDIFIPCKTRGDVRRLAVALGINLSPNEKEVT
jgi:hypothetical protein